MWRRHRAADPDRISRRRHLTSSRLRRDLIHAPVADRPPSPGPASPPAPAAARCNPVHSLAARSIMPSSPTTPAVVAPCALGGDVARVEVPVHRFDRAFQRIAGAADDPELCVLLCPQRHHRAAWGPACGPSSRPVIGAVLCSFRDRRAMRRLCRAAVRAMLPGSPAMRAAIRTDVLTPALPPAWTTDRGTEKHPPGIF